MLLDLTWQKTGLAATIVKEAWWSLQGKESQPEPSGLLDLREGIDTCFAGSSCQAIYTALQERGDSWSQDTLKALHK